jgi:hypothetical protein
VLTIRLWQSQHRRFMGQRLLHRQTSSDHLLGIIHCRCYHNLFRLMRKCGVLENLLAKEHTHTFCNTGGDVRELDFRFDVNGVKIGAPFHGAGAPALQSVHVPHCACHTAIPHRPTGTARIMRNSGSAGSQLEHFLACRVEGFLHHPAADSHRQGAHALLQSHVHVLAGSSVSPTTAPREMPCPCTAVSDYMCAWSPNSYLSVCYQLE